MSPDSVVLDILFVRFPLADPEINEQLWEEIDEQHFPAQLRRRLQRNGFRVGLVGNPIPFTLTKLLELEDKPQPTGKASQLNVADMLYSNAQPQMAIKAFPQRDGRVRLELVPELHHGQPQMRPVADSQGMFRLVSSRPRREFDKMAISAVLSPGSTLLLGSLPNHPGSLGHHFFTEDNGHLEQKLLVIRLSQTQHDEMFAPPEALRLEE
jgi:hypothetical protein